MLETVWLRFSLRPLASAQNDSAPPFLVILAAYLAQAFRHFLFLLLPFSF
jgi:hypothetical protein